MITHIQESLGTLSEDSLRLIAALCDRLVTLECQTGSTADRIISVLIEHHGKLDATQPELATMINRSRTSVEKTLRYMKEAGWINTGYRHIGLKYWRG